MNLDVLALTALVDECQDTIVSGRIQQAIQVTPLIFGLEVYAHRQRHYLILAADSQQSGLYLQTQKPRRGSDNPSPLSQLLKKYAVGGQLTAIEQPPLERLLYFKFSKLSQQTEVVFELFGTRSNLIFLDDKQRILALARPAPAKKRERVLLPNHDYTPPPSQVNKTPINTVTEATLTQVIRTNPGEKALSKTLINHFSGLSPLLATESVYRAYQQWDLRLDQVEDVQPLLTCLQEMFLTKDWQPTLAYTEAGTVKAVSAVALTHWPQTQSCETMSQALVASNQEAEDGYAAARKPLRDRLAQEEKRLQRRLEKLAEDAAKLKNPVLLKQKGEAILAYSYQIEAQQTTLEVPWIDEQTLTIALDTNLSPSENAQRYFARYQKAKRAADIIPEQEQYIRLQQDYVQQLKLDLELAESRPEIDVIASLIKNTKFGHVQSPEQAAYPTSHGVTGTAIGSSKKKNQAKKHKPSGGSALKLTSPDGWTVWVGKNAQQNVHLTFHLARPNDIWLHARDIPGAHVIILTASGEPPETTLLWAAGLAAYYSKARYEAHVDVSYTSKKHVRAIKGAPPGLVRIRHEKTVCVSPISPNS